MGSCVCKYNLLTVLWKVQCYCFFILDYLLRRVRFVWCWCYSRFLMCIQAISHRKQPLRKNHRRTNDSKGNKKEKTKNLTWGTHSTRQPPTTTFISPSFLCCEFEWITRMFSSSFRHAHVNGSREVCKICEMSASIPKIKQSSCVFFLLL